MSTPLLSRIDELALHRVPHRPATAARTLLEALPAAVLADLEIQPIGDGVLLSWHVAGADLEIEIDGDRVETMLARPLPTSGLAGEQLEELRAIIEEVLR